MRRLPAVLLLGVLLGVSSGAVAQTINYSGAALSQVGGVTAGSVPFGGTNGLSQDNAGLFWDDTNNRLYLNSTATSTTSGLLGRVNFDPTNDNNVSVHCRATYAVGNQVPCIKLQLGENHSRPWIMWFDTSDALKVGLGYHYINAADEIAHDAFEIKTVTTAPGTTPTRFSIGTSADYVPARLDYLSSLEVDTTKVTPSASHIGAELAHAVTHTGNYAGTTSGVKSSLSLTPLSTFSFSGFAAGLNGAVGNDGAGTVTQAIGGLFGILNNSTGTITNAKGVQVSETTNTGGGAITSNAGLVVENHTAGTNNTNVLLGTATLPSGNFSLHNASTAVNVHRGDSRFGSVTAPSATVHVGGNNRSQAAWTTGGVGVRVDGDTYTDTSSSGTVALQGVHAIAIPTVAASSSTTYTTSATLHLAGGPIAGSNVTQSGRYALSIGQDGMRVIGNTLIGGTTSINVSNNSATNIGTGTTTSDVTLGGGGSGQEIVFGSPQILKNYTVATLPTCNAGLTYAWAAVSDATVPTYNGSLVGGGAVKVPVFCDGSAWTSH